MLLQCEKSLLCWCRAAANVQFDGPSRARNRRDVAIPRRAHKASGSCRHDRLRKHNHNCTLVSPFKFCGLHY